MRFSRTCTQTGYQIYISSPQLCPSDAARRGRVTASMGHRCCGSDIHGPSLRLPGPAEQHRCPIVAVAARGWRPGAWCSGSGRPQQRAPDTGAERAGNRAARNSASAVHDAVTFTLREPEPPMLPSASDLPQGWPTDAVRRRLGTLVWQPGGRARQVGGRVMMTWATPVRITLSRVGLAAVRRN